MPRVNRKNKHPVQRAPTGLIALTVTLFALGACKENRAAEERSAVATSASKTCVTFQRGALGTVADTQLAADGSLADKNDGAGPTLNTGQVPSQPGALRRSLLRFDLSSIPLGAAVASAKLVLLGMAGSGQVRAHRVLAPWDEASVTWNNFGGAFAPLTEGSGEVTSGLVTLDLRMLVDSWVSGAIPNHGMLLEQSPSEISTFASSDALKAGARPSLQVCYSANPCAGVVCNASDACHVAGVCDPKTGLCGSPEAPDFTPCDDGDACSPNDICVAGGCTPTAANCVPGPDAKLSSFTVQDGMGGPALKPGQALPPALSACGVQRCDEDVYCPTPPGGAHRACLLQTFSETRWRVCVSDSAIKGLQIGPVDFKRTPSSAWMRILYQAGVAEIFVPYHSGAPRLFDTQFGSPAFLDAIDASEVGPSGAPLVLSGDSIAKVGVECRDRGLAWLCKGPNSSASRRGRELVLFGVYDPGNYDFVTEYGFRDDGTLTFRVGATGYNLASTPAKTFEPHMHNVLWRVDMDLNGRAQDSAHLVSHVEPGGASPPLSAADQSMPFNLGVEGGVAYQSLNFSTLVIEDAAKNSFGNTLGYELLPLDPGRARHHNAPADNFTLKDFYVTRWHASELGFLDVWAPPNAHLMTHLTTGFGSPESIANNDLVLWHISTAHHDPTDEDRAPGDPPSEMRGTTLMHWAGFDLKPHNLFNYNPLGGPGRCN